MKQRTLYVICGIPAAILCFLFLTLLFTPNDTIKGALVRLADNGGYTLNFTGFGKRFPSGFKASSLEISSEKGPLIKLNKVHLGLELLPLLVGKLRVSYDGMIGAGEIEGSIDLGKTQGWSVHCSNVPLEDIPFFTTVADAKVKGLLRLDGNLVTKQGLGKGDLQLEVRGAELAGVKVGQMPLPDANYKQIRGALSIDKGRATLKSFTLEGDGLYMRLRGDTMLAAPVGSSPLNLALEMMPKPAFIERQKFIFLLLMKYQSSPGAFSIPISGTLAHPSMR
jgi:type II secretion system protein N